MSVLDKQLKPLPPRRSRKRLYISLGILAAVIAFIFLFTNLNADVAFVVHFATPPRHLTYNGHANYISAVAWSPDGKRIASASGDHTAQIWDAATGKLVLTYRGHSSDVSTLAWSPDGQYIATGSLDTTVQIWNATTGATVYTYRGHSDAVYDVAWSPDSQRIASASNDGTVQIWMALSGKLLATYTGSSNARGAPVASNAVAWSPGGKDVAIGGPGPAILIDAATARVLGYYGPNGGSAHAVAFSPNGQYLAVGRDDSTVEVWDVASVKNVYTYFGQTTDVFTLAWSPDGQRIASGSGDGTVQIWDALTGGHVYTYRGHADYYWGHFTSGQAVDTLAWSPNGKQIASGSTDNTVQVWTAM
jgi:eukaryotic-like serine/threonine-protein kinase